MELSATTMKNIPKLVSPTFNVKDNYYLVKTGLLYNYYPIKVKPYLPEHSLIRFEKSPPVIMEGIAIVGKKAYLVTPQDLMRQVIHKSKEIVIPKREALNGNTESPSTSALRSTVQYPNKRATSGEASLEITQAADNAWEEQVGALLDLISAKEGFEFEVQDSA